MENERIEHLLQQAGECADRDAAQVALGLEARVMSRIREARTEGARLAQWANGFWRGALVSALVALGLAAWTWWSADHVELGGDLAVSALADDQSVVEFWPSTW